MSASEERPNDDEVAAVPLRPRPETAAAIVGEGALLWGQDREAGNLELMQVAVGALERPNSSPSAFACLEPKAWRLLCTMGQPMFFSAVNIEEKILSHGVHQLPDTIPGQVSPTM